MLTRISTAKMDSLKKYIAISSEEFNHYIKCIDEETIRKAAELIIAAKRGRNRLHITGIGKPAHVANYAASLFLPQERRRIICMVRKRFMAPVGNWWKATSLSVFPIAVRRRN